MNKTFILLASCIIYGFQAFSQTFPLTVEWADPVLTSVGDEQFSMPVIKDQDYENGLPLYSFRQQVKNGNFTLSYASLTTTAAPAVDIQFIERYKFIIPETPQVNMEVSKGGSVNYLSVSVLPYIKKNGQVMRITGLTVTANQGPASSSYNTKDYAATSVLEEGQWYRINVSEDGVYKIDRDFLERCGIDVESVNPQQINIYGNASGRLSEFNSAYFYDDLAKNAILVSGEGDGVFNDEDYILFYGAGPNRWDYSVTLGYNRDQQIYSKTNSYFIHVSTVDPPLRIASASMSDNPSTHNVSSYTYYSIHENESRNLVKGGQRWYGEVFDAELTQNISFPIPDIDFSTPVNAKVATCTSAPDTGSFFRYSHNGGIVYSQAMPGGGGSGSYARNTASFNFNPASGNVNLSVTLDRENASIVGVLDYISITARRSLKMTGSQMIFRDLNSVGIGNVGQFEISAMPLANTVWEITNKRVPSVVNGINTGSVFSFKADTDTLREFIAFTGSDYRVPVFAQVVPNQNLHALGQADFIIVTPPQFEAQAQRLAGLHLQLGTTSHVVTTQQVYNEFSSGMQDATAIRRFVKMFYDRAGGNAALKPQNLLLFGDVTYDPKDRLGNNNYMVPTYEVIESESYIYGLVTDDYFGFLDDNESNTGSNGMDIGVGRLLISTSQHAIEQVNKIEHYMKNGSTLYANSADPNSCCNGNTGSTFGDWRTNYTIITDDEQQGIFITTDAEPVSELVYEQHPEMNITKIYSDAYQQTSSAGGTRFPAVYDAITDRIQRGTLIMNYIGHGGETGAADERFITIPQILSWTNIDKMTVFVSATCEFTRFDDPSRVSAGEWVALNPTGGGIALMTTSRSVLIGVNSQTVASFYTHVFDRETDGTPLTFGEIMRRTKNTSGTSQNRRSFNLIGDPALKIALPRYRIVTDSINHLDPGMAMDTVRALSKMSVKGHLEDEAGNPVTAFNGVLSPTIFDKPKMNQTLGQDALSPVISFETQNNALYKGKATVTNGNFSFEFIVPKDINYQYGAGKISYYSEQGGSDAIGFDTNFIIGGLDTAAAADAVGPTIDIYLNDNEFVNGGISSQTPVLIVDCFDDYGINTVGNGVGHDLIAILDGNTAEPIVLNNYYTANLDSYQSGRILYTMKTLPIGEHTLDVKIWDVNNNSASARIAFNVVADQEIKLEHVLNYPNPFTTKTTFFYEHNQSCSSLETQIQIFTVSGRLVKTINKLVPTTGFRTEGIDWDGRDDFGDQLAKGVYVYRLTVELPEGGTAQKLEKLVLLR